MNIIGNFVNSAWLRKGFFIFSVLVVLSFGQACGSSDEQNQSKELATNQDEIKSSSPEPQISKVTEISTITTTPISTQTINFEPTSPAISRAVVTSESMTTVTSIPSATPTTKPTAKLTSIPAPKATATPTAIPSATPTTGPIAMGPVNPTDKPTPEPTATPAALPTATQTVTPQSYVPTKSPNVFDQFGFTIVLEEDSDFGQYDLKVSGVSQTNAEDNQGLITFVYKGVDVGVIWLPSQGESHESIIENTYFLLKSAQPVSSFTVINVGTMKVGSDEGQFSGFLLTDTNGTGFGGGLIGVWACGNPKRDFTIIARGDDPTSLQIRFDRVLSGFNCSEGSP